MRLSMPNYIKLNLIQILKNGGFLIGIVLAILPSIGIAYSILKLKGPFTIFNVSSLFCTFGIIVPVIIAISAFSKDFHYGTISMMFNSKKNRVNYFFSNIIFATLLGVLFGIVGAITVNITSQLGVPGEVNAIFYVKFILTFTLCIIFYMLCAYLLILLFKKGSVAYITLLVAIAILPNLLYTLKLGVSDSLLEKIIDNTPFYFLSVELPSGTLVLSQYFTLITSVALLGVVSILLSIRKEI